jgi:hypothetical protein
MAAPSLNHWYELIPPQAVKVAKLPGQKMVSEAVNVQLGNGFTVTGFDAVAVQPMASVIMSETVYAGGLAGV